jgi:hypothetical protein
MKLVLLIACVGICLAHTQDTTMPEDEYAMESMPSSEENLLSVAKQLHATVPTLLQEHTAIIAKHAAMIQSNRAKAYAHNFKNSKKAIKSALKSLTDQLYAGHKHDKKAIGGARHFGNGVISKAEKSGKSKTATYRQKACPTKRLELEAKARMNAEAQNMKNIGNGKICKHIKGHTMGAMDVDKATPAYGTKLRNAWDRARARYISATKKHAAAAKKYRSAKANYDRAMASFKAALNIEASNAHRACKNAHTEYNALVKDVQSNVNSRKQVWISSLVVMCYIDNLTSNAAAKRCADKKRRTSTARWNIHTPRLAACKNKATLIKNFGPANWLPSSRTCHMKHWNEAKFKEQGVKERKAKERKHKEQRHKESTSKERRVKERTNKERNAKAKKERDAKHRKEQAAKREERISKERTNKERSAKNAERSSKARERAWKASRLSPGQCCWFLHGCSSCCDKCPGGNHWVWPHVCGTSRRCNRL